MLMIAFKNKETGREIVAHIATDTTVEQATKNMGLADGEWREINQAEADRIQAPTPEELIVQYDRAIDQRLENFARQLYSKGYANAVTYVNSNNAQWKLEAEYLIQLRDDTWQAAYEYMNEVMPQVLSGICVPPTWDDVVAALPVPTWPEGSRGYVAPQA